MAAGSHRARSRSLLTLQQLKQREVNPCALPLSHTAQDPCLGNWDSHRRLDFPAFIDNQVPLIGQPDPDNSSVKDLIRRGSWLCQDDN